MLSALLCGAYLLVVSAIGSKFVIDDLKAAETKEQRERERKDQ